MNEQKLKIFENTLTKPFDHKRYTYFLKELLVNMTVVAPDREIKPYNTFSAAVNHYRHIGNYVGEDRNKVALFSVCLKNDKNLENARSMQRAFVKTLLENSDCAGALVAFFTDEELDKWRLSLVRMDYDFTQGKLNQKLTPAKRYSYLVGKGEPCHTAQERLYPIFEDDNTNPSLDDLEEAFSVEAVTKDFFNQYREKYLDLKEYLDSNPDFIAEANSRGFDSEQFAKKLMGQIVFLYFIQKKGWLGVNAFPKKLTEREYKWGFYRPGQKPKELMPRVYKLQGDGAYHRDNNAVLNLSQSDETLLSTLVKGDAWGNGPKDFMRQIFEGCRNAEKNFFDDYLEPLFYTGLNQNRGDNAFFPPLHRRIPFLNGGLFEEMEGYDWRNNDFRIPNELFSNSDTKGKREADGILDVFDRFNFTMAEDEPMEREVAIDPEMLGKVFENLLDVTDRKSKGAFYTPREIVHYMCQESLISFLVQKTGILEEDIRKFILYGEYFRDEDTKKTLLVHDEKTGKQHYVFDFNKGLEIPETIFSFKKKVNRLIEIDNYLAEVKIADPAVGSGAFPLGMLNEIVKARETITSYMTITMNSFQRLTYRTSRNTYSLKRDTIKNCIFACDLEASATDITKLRLWLSLVIDNQIMDQDDEQLGYSTKPRELPNLDCNIICGNSLLNSFKGVPLVSENSALNNISSGSTQNGTIFDESIGLKINKLIELQDKLYEEKNHAAKESLKNEIQSIYDEIILDQIGTDGELAESYYLSQQEASKPFVIWQLYFPKVFASNGGFDIVIGNPPYIQLQKAMNDDTKEKLGDLYVNEKFKTFAKTGDIYCLFYEKGYNLLKDGGTLAFITSNKWMRAGYGEKLRGFLAEKTNPIKLIDFAGQKVFESATVDVNILIYTKEINKGMTLACIIKDNCANNLSVYIEQNNLIVNFTSNESWVILSPIENSIKLKMKNKGTALSNWNLSINYGIKTGLNDAFIITGRKRDELISKDPKSAELIRPILRGRDIKQYYYSFADLWLINVHNGIARKKIPPININDYPAIKAHLDQFYEKLSKRADKGVTPYNLRNCTYIDDFFKTKIIYPETTQGAFFVLDNNSFFADKTCFIMLCETPEYLMATLSSKLFEFAYKRLFSSIELGKNGYQYNKHALIKLPVIDPSNIEEDIYKELLKRVNVLIKPLDIIDSSDCMRKIDDIIFKLYEISDEEIAYINHYEA